MQYFLLGFIVVDLLNGVLTDRTEQIRLDGKQVIFGKMLLLECPGLGEHFPSDAGHPCYIQAVG